MNKILSKFRKYKILIIIIAILVCIEIYLRIAFGLGSPVLSQADTYTGYRFQPNQSLVRFGKKIEYNQYSQRSEPINLLKPKGNLRILMVGDSVLNGGNPIDQKQIITEQLEDKFKASGEPTEILNASAGSWGIGNHLGYLKEFGTFNSDAVILQIGTHDLTQPTSTSERVGKDPNYPNHPPLLAIQEALTRYILPRFLGNVNLNPFSNQEIPQLSPAQVNQQFQKNMELFKAAVKLVREKKIPIYVLFTPNRYDLIPKPATPPYKPEFMQVLKSLQVPIFDTYEAWSKLPTNVVATYFRDEVHLSEAGYKTAANLIFQQLCIEQKFSGCVLASPSRSQ
ncbi:SGNH/GDSL hydrolase family protein [Nostoc sp. FACHB-152]|uniref:SGNH/GDSL hydrolase family protein n=1 Tax=unclassified Nostoc TaxID=2593658 RepID=UPI001688D74D|nr:MULTISPECIES: SGNH/GDSL hydrolase family protein [unclassified Nostoc]MBD2451098.1 SGNH/GDSL hydrolase family protein [Nostoc sp. FACHB-152]MBD2472457.1 SGNH/GDSL hydrolase family protein [Nostoc sp. FACHB-145]